MILFFVSTLFYPGGSQDNINTVGYDWQHNYISNLFAWTAINGQASNSPIWAAGGMFVLSYSFSLFFIRFSQKIPVKSASLVIKYFGVAAMFFVFLAVTPYHDTMSVSYTHLDVYKRQDYYFSTSTFGCAFLGNFSSRWAV